MAGVAGLRCFRSSSRNCLLSNALRSNLGRSENRLTSVLCHDYGRLWTGKRAYASGIETSDEKQDPKDKPIRFSTSKARYMTLNQTLGYGGEIERNSSKKSIYIGLIGMAIMTYIIFFLPADEEDELDLLDEVEIVAGQTKEQS